MEITITKQMAEAMDGKNPEHPEWKELPEIKAAKNILSQQFSVTMDEFRWNNGKSITIRQTPHEMLKKLSLAFQKLPGVRGHRAAFQAINTWLASRDTTGQKVAKNVQQWVLLAIAYFAEQEHQRVYCQMEEDRGMRAYHMGNIEYHPARSGKGWYSPPYATLQLVYREFGTMQTRTKHISQGSCVGNTTLKALAHAEVFVENDELRATYLEEHTRWDRLVTRIGFQCIGRGQATEIDGAAKKDRWYWRDDNVVSMTDGLGEPSRVVIDVYNENESKAAKDDSGIDLDWWEKQRTMRVADEKAIERAKDKLVREKRSEDDDDYEPEDEIEVEEDAPSDDDADVEITRKVIEVPVYPMVAVFDMKRHRRLRCHISQLEDYVYDVKLGTRLILPPDVRDLVGVLLGHKAQFADVIAGKGGGVCILCAGPPGTGKTLTAEVYAEVMKRPLYSVQTAQLGLNAGAVEDSLRLVFARAARWGAILLLDEADVYVRERQNDLEQNAIVGVFLRTLEYYQGILFLTTNRADSIDDAIASRCIARIDYKTPHPNDQMKIWRMLAETIGVELSEDVLTEIAARKWNLSGRDIKNVLKLSQMWATAKKQPVTVETIEMARRFKPTGPGNQEEEAREGGGLDLSAHRAPRSLK